MLVFGGVYGTIKPLPISSFFLPFGRRVDHAIPKYPSAVATKSGKGSVLFFAVEVVMVICKNC